MAGFSVLERVKEIPKARAISRKPARWFGETNRPLALLSLGARPIPKSIKSSPKAA